MDVIELPHFIQGIHHKRGYKRQLEGFERDDDSRSANYFDPLSKSRSNTVEVLLQRCKKRKKEEEKYRRRKSQSNCPYIQSLVLILEDKFQMEPKWKKAEEELIHK